MPELRYSFPMVTEEDATRFRHLWASLTHDPHVVRADTEHRDNPFIQRVIVEIREGREGLADWVLAGSLQPYLETPLTTRRLQGFPRPTEDALASPPSALADTTWMELVPRWVRPGCWVRSGDVRFMVLRVDVPANCAILQAEDKPEPESVHLDALRFFLAGEAPPPKLPPAPSVWDRLLGTGFDD